MQDNLVTGSATTYSISPATNQLNRYNSVTNAYDTYTYDAAGNLINSGTGDIGGHSYTYNALSQITAVDGGVTGSYQYDGLDERVYKYSSAGETGYIYFAGQPLAELSSTGIWTDYIYAEGQKIAKVSNAQSRLRLSGVNVAYTSGYRASMARMTTNARAIQAGLIGGGSCAGCPRAG